MNANADLSTLNLDLDFEDLEAKPDKCCGSSTTLPFCTCPIGLTDCCSMIELAAE